MDAKSCGITAPNLKAEMGNPPESELVATLRELPGQWVATKGQELLVAASTPHDVVSWLAQNHLKADSMFRVPEDELAASGLAPL
jgi:hypothetical protein